jgi:hypothetical protein
MADRASLLIRRLGVARAIILTPLYWVFNAVRDACDRARVDSIWSEVFLTEKLILDRVGCQYTADSELVRYADTASPLDPEPLGPTRFGQPGDRDPAEMRRAVASGHGRIVALFGQVPGDNALADSSGGMPYREWIDAVVGRNPSTLFVFKHHPAVRTPGVEAHRNLRAVKESLRTLLAAFEAFAAYSSTVIIEGAAETGRLFATGGHHLLGGNGLCLRVRSPNEAEGLYERIRGARPDPAALKKRLGFVTRRYALRPSSPDFARRLNESSESFFLS